MSRLAEDQGESKKEQRHLTSLKLDLVSKACLLGFAEEVRQALKGRL